MPSNQIQGISIPDPKAQRVARAAQAQREIRKKMDDLPPECEFWAGALTIDCDEETFLRLMQAFAHVLAASRADGSTFVPVTRSDLCDAIGVTPDLAGQLLNKLEQEGMVQRRTRMIGLADVYRPLRASDANNNGEARVSRSAPGSPSRPLPSPITDKRLLAGLLGMRPA